MDNKIRPIYVELRNFGSFGNKVTRVDFPGPGESMLIRGPVGSGKSSILNAMFWCITGKKMSRKGGTLVNTVNQKNMVVTCAWVIPGEKEPLVVTRGMKPAQLKVSGVDGTIQKEMAQELTRRLPITDPQVLLNLCILSVSRSLPFFDLGKQDRMGFLRNFVDTQLLDTLAVRSKNVHLDSKRESDILSGEVRVLTSQVASMANKLHTTVCDDEKPTKAMNQDYRAKVERGKTVALKLLKRADEDLSSFSTGVYTVEPDDLPDREYKSPEMGQDILANIEALGLSGLNEKLKGLQDIKRKILARLESVNKSITNAEADASGIESIECRAYFDSVVLLHRDDLAILKPDLQQVNSVLDDLENKVEQTNSKARKIKRGLGDIQTSIIQARQRLQADISQLTTMLDFDDKARQHVNEIEAKKAAWTTLDGLRKETEAKLEEMSIRQATLSRRTMIAAEYRTILDSTWSYMTRRMVPYLNSRIPVYMKALDMDFHMALDSSDISKPIFKGRPGVGHLKLEDLSTGQKRVLSFCLAHALRDLEATTHGVDIGFLAVDELSGNFDSDLVDRMMEFEFGYMGSHQSSLIVITHDIALQQRSEWDHIYSVDRNVFSTVDKVK